jgi:Holliday junction resolvase RusA-like endonuclease
VNASKGIDTRGRTGKKAVVYLLPEVLAWKRDAELSFHNAQQYVETIHLCRETPHPLYLALVAFMPLDRLLSRDSDNFIKLTQDFLCKDYLAIEDVYVFDVHASKRLCPVDTSAYVHVSLYWNDELEIEGLDTQQRRQTRKRAA